MDEKLRSMRRQLFVEFDEDLLERYYRALQRAGFKMCGCESGLCDSKESPHVINPRFGSPGFCLEPVDDRVKVEYVSMCDGCAVELPSDYHLGDCSCSKCSGGGEALSPQEEVAGLMEPTMDDLAEPGLTDEGLDEW